MIQADRNWNVPRANAASSSSATGGRTPTVPRTRTLPTSALLLDSEHFLEKVARAIVLVRRWWIGRNVGWSSASFRLRLDGLLGRGLNRGLARATKFELDGWTRFGFCRRGWRRGCGCRRYWTRRRYPTRTGNYRTGHRGRWGLLGTEICLLLSACKCPGHCCPV